jgi:hypothetical protein
MKKSEQELIPHEDLWQGMPEFQQDKQKTFSKIVFRFENQDDLQRFAKLIDQKLTPKTKSAWYPSKPHRRKVKEVWVQR